jgi:phosphate-selective porin OprO/OprP
LLPPLRHIGVLWILIGLIMCACPFAAAAEPSKILIRNVRLIDRDGHTEDLTVSILIKDGKLNVITTDQVDPEEGMSDLDARDGVVMGDLDVGSPANFLIVDENPLEDVEVLLDTKTHVVFAIRQGLVVRNTLPGAGPAELVEGGRKKNGWIAYTPPAMALPLTYQDSNKWNRWENRFTSGLFISALALDRQRWLAQDEANEQQVGELKAFDGGEIRAFRLGIVGSLKFKRPWYYQLVVVTHAFDKGYDSKTGDDVTFFDYRVDIPLLDALTLSVGKQKEPISMDRLLLGTQMQMTERAAVLDAMFQVRNVGAVFSGNIFDRRSSWAVGVFNDWFDDSQSFDESSSQAVGRVTALPWVSDDNSHLVHLGLGIRYDDGVEGYRYAATAEFNQSPLYIDTGEFEAASTLTSDLEVSWRRGPYWVSTEYVHNSVRGAQVGDPVFSGYHVSASWILTGEMRKYIRRNGTFGVVPVARSVYQGGIGAWEVSARYSSIDFNAGLVEGGAMDVVSLGLNWLLTPTFVVNFNYRHIELDRFGVRGGSDGLMGRVILVLE